MNKYLKPTPIYLSVYLSITAKVVSCKTTKNMWLFVHVVYKKPIH